MLTKYLSQIKSNHRLCSVGPGTSVQELQEPPRAHQKQSTNKKPPECRRNQKAKVAAAKGHTTTQGPQKDQELQEPQGAPHRRVRAGHPPQNRPFWHFPQTPPWTAARGERRAPYVLVGAAGDLISPWQVDFSSCQKQGTSRGKPVPDQMGTARN